MAKIISIINQAHPTNLMFILDLAHLIKLTGKSVAIVRVEAFQKILFNYQFDLVDFDDIALYDSIDELNDEAVVLYNGYHQTADYFMLLSCHDLFSIKALSRRLGEISLETATFVLLDALDVKQQIDYVYTAYLERFVDCPKRLTISFDERAAERYLRCQLAQKIDLKGISRQRLTAYWKLLIDILDDAISQRELKQLIKRS